MRCARCHFENIPGQDRCVRCHSILEAGTAVIQVHPPRMPAWSKPFRGFARWLRGHRAVPEELSAAPIHAGLTRARSDPLIGLALSIVPGLGHLIQGRFKEAGLWVLAWLILVSTGVFCWGGQIGFLLLGLAIGVHGWIAVQAGLWEKLTELTERAMAVLGIMLALALLYWAMPRVLFPGYTGVHALMTIPGMKIHVGDYLLARRVVDTSVLLPRGSLVLVHPAGLLGTLRLDHPYAMTLGQIVGLPLETVQIQDGAYVVGGRRLDPAKFPVPTWLRGRSYSIHLAADSYFLSAEYRIAGHGNPGLTGEAITKVSTFARDDIRGRAFLRWWPLSRRGFIE